MLASILGVSMVLQFAAAYLAIRLMRQTGWWLAWMLLAAAMALMGLRRCIGLYVLLRTGVNPDPGQELVALAISVLVVAGVALIGPALAAARGTEAALREQKAFSDSLIETAQMVVLLLDTQGRIVTFNPYLENLSGYTVAEMKGKDWFTRFLPEQDWDRVRAFFQQVMREGISRGYINPIVTRDGRLRQIEWHAMVLRDGKGNAIGLLNNGQDVTERVQAEETLRRSRELLEQQVQERTSQLNATNCQLQQEIAERRRTEEVLRVRDRAMASTGNGILIADARHFENPIIYANPAVEAITGYTRQEILGRNCRFLQGNERDQLGLMEVRAALIQGCECRAVLRNYKKDGTLFWNELTLSPVRDEQGQLTHYVGIQNDITKRVQAEEQARALQAELAHMERQSLAGALASGLAHELNQPLTAIATYSEACLQLLKTGLAQMDEQMQTIEQIAAQSLRAGEIIRRMKEFIRKRAPQRSVVEVNVLLREVAGLIGIEAKRRQVTLELELTEPLPAVYADHIQIQQVVLNLALNGIEAMQETEPGRRELLVRTRLAGAEVIEVSVCDTGSGLSPEAVERLFQPFFTTKSRGMGLGLSISKSIIEAHQGRLWASANDRHGTTFHFTLPVAQQRLQTALASAGSR